jgi:hypothetical protein
LILYIKNKIICNKGPINFAEYGPKLVFRVKKTTPFGGAALQVKTFARNVEKIAVLMSPKDLEIEDNCGCTAMEVIAKMAKCTIRENEGNG